MRTTGLRLEGVRLEAQGDKRSQALLPYLKSQASSLKPAVRVLFVNHSARVSGAELSLLEILARLDRSRFVPELACPGGPLARRARDLGVPHVPLRLRRVRRERDVTGFARALADLGLSSLHLSRVITRRHADIVHANSTTAFLSAGPAAALARVSALWHVRDLVDLGLVGLGLYRLADRVICISEAVRRHMLRYGDDPGRIVTVRNGVDLAAVRAAARPGTIRREFGIAPDAPVIVQVGQITPWKGHDFLLGALARVKDRFPDLRVLLVGEAMTPEDEAHRERLRRRVGELALDRVVAFTGWRDDAASFMADADVVVMPSRDEPFGRAAVEAMALGRPVVGADAGGLPEILTDGTTGLLVPYGDTVRLANALMKLLRSPKTAATMGQNARRAADAFDVAATVDRLQRLYDEVLARRTRKG